MLPLAPLLNFENKEDGSLFSSGTFIILVICVYIKGNMILVSNQHFDSRINTKMGRSHWCKSYHTSHKGPIGSKCEKFDSQTQEDGAQASLETQASSIASANETVVSEEHARLVAQQVDVNSVTNCHETSTGDKGVDAGQQLILKEIQKIAKRFGALEEQTARDREVLTGLVSQVNQ